MPEGVQGVIIAELNETEYTDPSYENDGTHASGGRTLVRGVSVFRFVEFGDDYALHPLSLIHILREGRP